MIFVTVGAQMPFDRLVRAVDEWAGHRGRRDVFAQIGLTSWSPTHLQYERFLPPPAFRAKVEAADVVVAHAGMGSIITALELGKPLIIMPRRGDLKETRNDHQMATARQFQDRATVAYDEVELRERLDELDSVAASGRVSGEASEALVGSLGRFVERGVLPRSGGAEFDSVLCFGSPHARGTSLSADLALMLPLARGIPVIYVPLGGGEVALAAGHCPPAFHVFPTSDPVATKGGYRRVVRRVKKMMKRLKVRAPLVWVARPVPVELIDGVPHAGLVVQHGQSGWSSAEPERDDFTGVESTPVESTAPGLSRPVEGASRRPSTLVAEADLIVLVGRRAGDAFTPPPGTCLAAEPSPAGGAEETLRRVLQALSKKGIRSAADSVEFLDALAAAPDAEALSAAQGGNRARAERLEAVSAGVNAPGLALAAVGCDGAAGGPEFSATADAGRRATSPRVLPRAVVMLGGTVRPTRFSAAIGRSLLELPARDGASVLDLWREQVLELGRWCGAELVLRVLVDRSSPVPADRGPWLRVQRDELELRGSGGLVRDVAVEYDPEDFLLLVGGVHLPLRPLVEVFEELSGTGGDLVVGAHHDRTPSCLMLCRCRTLLGIPSGGFVDLKEQALPLIAREHAVKVRTGMDLSAAPIRTESQYIAALREYASRRAGVEAGAFAEEWQSRFGLVEQGARVDPSATVHDSVVLRGGQVGAGAAVVQSVVCPGAVVGRGALAGDTLVTGGRGAGGAWS